MTNKLLLSTLIASSFFIAAQANAVDQSGTAKFNLVAPIEVAETTQMEFGDVTTLKADSCIVAFDNTASGNACVAGGAAAATGLFTINAKGAIKLSVTGEDTSISGVKFTPNLELANITVDSSNTVTAKVGGTVEITDITTAATGPQTLSYTLSVIY